MNRQALAFLTMFSLVLMLSVYYVTLPQEDATVMKEESTETQDTQQTAAKQAQDKDDTLTAKQSDTSNAKEAEQLQQKISEKKDAQVEEYAALVSKKDAAQADKQEALAKIDQLKEEKTTQSTIVAKLKKNKLDTAVEIDEGTCIVSVFNGKDSKEAVAAIMQQVHDMTNQKYFVEVTFK